MTSSSNFPPFCFIGTDDPIVLGQVIDSLPALPSCELMDPADDQTLALLVEALEKRHRVRQIMSEQLNKTGMQPPLIPCCCPMFNVALSKCIYFTFGLGKQHSIHCEHQNYPACCPTANTLRSMLQQLDGQLNAKETFLHDQRSKLGEKEKLIGSQKSEIERLEKKSKTLEYKVLPRFIDSALCLQGCQSKIVIFYSAVCLLRLISYRRRQKCTSRTNAHFSRSWRLGSKSCRKS